LKDINLPRKYWENKILKWEKVRYSSYLLFYPASWTIRYRMHASLKILKSQVEKSWSVCELGCGSGILADNLSKIVARYHGVDIAKNAIDEAVNKYANRDLSFEVGDVVNFNFQPFDLYLFLGLTDWLEINQLESLFLNLKTKNVFFSYTESKVLSPLNPYRIYRNFKDKEIKKNSYQALTYSEEEIKNLLEKAGFEMSVMKKASWIDPGVLVWGKK